jgi:hypothetical protein
MEYINEQWPEHGYSSCNDKNMANSGFNRCARCTALELRELEIRRLKDKGVEIDEEE